MLTHLDDVASDFSAIHRVPDIRVLSGPVFFRFAFRLTAYESVMRARHMDAAADGVPAPGHAPAAGPQPGGTPRRGAAAVPATRTAVMAHPELSKIISFAA